MHLGILVLAPLTNPMTDQARIHRCGSNLLRLPDGAIVLNRSFIVRGGRTTPLLCSQNLWPTCSSSRKSRRLKLRSPLSKPELPTTFLPD
jgi:hypothetical protein